MGSKSNADGVPCVLVHTDRGEAAMTLPDAVSVFGVSEALRTAIIAGACSLVVGAAAGIVGGIL